MRIWAKLGLASALGLAVIAGPALVGESAAIAQSAADKATARQLATEAIKLYRAGKHAEALDKMQRAQNLYDAPPHLLYIARSQVALGKVVEGAETYRTLSRSDIPAGSPPAFKQAQDEGKAELAELEPKIPAVTITVKPEGVSGLDVRIDGEQVPAAIVGVERPINPGRHTVRVTAPGFNTAEQTVDVKLGEKKPVALDLQTAGGAAPVVGPAPVPGPGPGPAPGPGPVPGPGPAPGPEPGPTTPAAAGSGPKIGFMLGARIGGAFPFGDATEDEPMSDFFGPGGGVEVQGGVRFAKYFTGKLIFAGFGFKAGDNAGLDDTIETENTTTATSGGIGFQAGTERGQFGGFGEIDVLFHHQFQIVNQVVGLDCEVTRKITGTGAFGIGGGLSVPLSSSFALTPFANFRFGQFEEIETDENCGLGVNTTQDIDSSSQKTHGIALVGLGFEFLFGPDKPAK